MKSKMKFTLVMQSGKVMRFHIKGLADMYCTIYGGRVFSKA